MTDQANSSSKYCPYCGEEVIPGAAFCPHCGKPLASEPAQAAPTAAKSAPVEPAAIPVTPAAPVPPASEVETIAPPKKRSACLTIVVVLVLISLCLTCLGVGGWFIYNRDSFAGLSIDLSGATPTAIRVQPTLRPPNTPQPQPTAAATQEPTVDIPTMEPMMATMAAKASSPIEYDQNGLAFTYYPEMATGATFIQKEEVNDPNLPPWESGPKMREITLEGYADSIQYIKPVIEVAEVADLLKIKPGMQDIYNRLKTMLDADTADDGTVQMPFLSETNAGQALSSNHKLVNFMNGKGLRYITFMTQGVGPINNDYLLYIYQGLTANGKYYVSATMPISAKALPDPATVPDMMDDVDGYYKSVSDMLDQQPANAFTPDLDYLDFFFISFNVKE